MSNIRASYSIDSYEPGSLLAWFCQHDNPRGGGMTGTTYGLENPLPSVSNITLNPGDAVFFVAGSKTLLPTLYLKGTVQISTSDGSNLGIAWDITNREVGKKLKLLPQLAVKIVKAKAKAALGVDQSPADQRMVGFGGSTLARAFTSFKDSFKSVFLVQVYNRATGQQNAPPPQTSNHLTLTESQITLGVLVEHLTGRTALP